MQLADTTLSFGCWRYSPGAGTLTRIQTLPEQAAETSFAEDAQSLPIVLEPRLHALLNHFLAQPDLIHAKTDLLDALWGDAEGTDSALMRAIGMLRKVLQDTSKPASYIETLPKRGYRWVAPIRLVSQPAFDKVPFKIKASVLNPADETEPGSALTSPLRDVEQTLPQKSKRRLKLLSAFFLCTVIALFVSLLLFFGKSNFVPAFTHQVTISAMAGQEQQPLLSRDQQTLYYQQLSHDLQWRWISHHLNSHRKQVQLQQFSALGAAQWYREDLVFQAVINQRCHIFRMPVSPFQQTAQPWLPCQQFSPQGLAAAGEELVWLDQHLQSGATQLWRLNGEKAQLQQTFAEGFRRPVAIVLDQQQVWVLLQQDDFNTSLFRYDLTNASLHKAADFPYAFHSMSVWDEKRLLLSSTAGSFIFVSEQANLITLQLATGSFMQQQRIGERLLATQVPRDQADLLPLKPSAAGRSSTLLSASPWLSSNRTDQLLSWNDEQAALVSERSGLPQIWWFDGSKVRQLTKFSKRRQIAQLLWADSELYAVIDQQLHLVSRNNGSLTAVLFQDRQLRHFAFCHGRWFWAEFSHQQWQLKTMNQQQLPIELMANIVDLRCAPDQSLLLQQQDGRLVRFWPEQERQQEFPWRLSWRQVSGNSWTTTSKGMYWIDPQGLLWHSGWQQPRRERLEQPGLLQVTGLYGQPEQEQVFLQLSREPETDVVWLQPHQFQ